MTAVRQFDIATPNDFWGGRDPSDPGPVPTGADPGVTGVGAGVRQWALGAFYVGNYPGAVHFHQDRLCFAGMPQNPQQINMSMSTAYETFSPSALLDDTVTDACACSFALNSNTVNAIRWLQSDQNGLIAGTAGGMWTINSASLTQPISPTSISAAQTSEYGAIGVAPVHVATSTLFLQLGARKLRDMKFNYMINGYESGELSPLADHLTVGGFTAMAMQYAPWQILWLVRADGQLVSLSYDGEQNEVAWVLHQLGGVGDALGNPTKVLSVEVISAPDGSRDEVWLAVQRYVNGAAQVNIERMSKLWEVGDAVADADGVPRYVPALTSYLDASQRLVSGSPTTTVSGLTWLEGQTVGVLADGGAATDAVVTGGSITLAAPAKDIVVGLNYDSVARTLPIEAGGGDGPAQGKIKRIHNVVFKVYESMGFSVKMGNNDFLTDVSFRATDDLMDAPPPLRTEDVRMGWEGTYDRAGQIEFHQSQPLPLNVAGLVIQLETEDG